MWSSIRVILFLLLVSNSAIADWVVPTDRVTNGVVIRATPSSHGMRLGLLTPGSRLDWVRDVPGWREVRLQNNSNGFVSKSYTRIEHASVSNTQQQTSKHIKVTESPSLEKTESFGPEKTESLSPEKTESLDSEKIESLSPENTESFDPEKDVYISIVDGGSDKCWTNASHVKQKARLTLEQSGIRVFDEPLIKIIPYPLNVQINGYGLRTNLGYCFGSIELTAFRKVRSGNGDQSFGSPELLIKKEYILGGEENLDNQILSIVDEFVSKFSLYVVAGEENLM